MSTRSPFTLFRFALRERDWPLAALLADTLARSDAGRRRLDRELEQARRRDRPLPSLLGLRVLAQLLGRLGTEAARG